MSLLRSYILLAVVVVYHAVAIFTIMGMLSSHGSILVPLALMWIISIPVTAYISARRLTPALKVIAQDFADKSKEG
ncbi:MAG: hypothetical protein M0R77_10300 [Gammaproteobacteria bacterium]|nr:hypothetical protein [Gammaproteobacteria bacterium]